MPSRACLGPHLADQVQKQVCVRFWYIVNSCCNKLQQGFIDVRHFVKDIMGFFVLLVFLNFYVMPNWALLVPTLGWLSTDTGLLYDCFSAFMGTSQPWNLWVFHGLSRVVWTVFNRLETSWHSPAPYKLQVGNVLKFQTSSPCQIGNVLKPCLGVWD